MTIHLTTSAADRVKRFLAGRETGLGLRLGIRKSGCSGFAYVTGVADAISESDRICESRGVKVVVDADSLPLLDGTEVDVVREGLNEGFVFRNPNVKHECGCGESIGF
jgi:iron-sulfur cluster assembly protein